MVYLEHWGIIYVQDTTVTNNLAECMLKNNNKTRHKHLKENLFRKPENDSPKYCM